MNVGWTLGRGGRGAEEKQAIHLIIFLSPIGTARGIKSHVVLPSHHTTKAAQPNPPMSTFARVDDLCHSGVPSMPPGALPIHKTDMRLTDHDQKLIKTMLKLKSSHAAHELTQNKPMFYKSQQKQIPPLSSENTVVSCSATKKDGTVCGVTAKKSRGAPTIKGSLNPW